MRAVNQPHVSPSTIAEGARAQQKRPLSQEIFDLHSSKRRMLLSWDLGIADAGCDHGHRHNGAGAKPLPSRQSPVRAGRAACRELSTRVPTPERQVVCAPVIGFFPRAVVIVRRSPSTLTKRTCSVPAHDSFHETSTRWTTLSPSTV